MIKFYSAAVKAGIKPICGCDVLVENSDGVRSRLVLLASNNQGYSNLTALVSAIYTEKGSKLLETFSKKICKAKTNWSMSSYKNQSIKNIRSLVGSNNVICGLSGGVDSTVTAVLLQKAIGEKLTCVFVDNGLLREGEANEVINFFTKKYKINLIFVDASKEFLAALKDGDRALQKNH